MKALLPIAALLALTVQPALADSCWISQSGSRVVFPADKVAVTYAHDGMAEPCTAEPQGRGAWRVWCEVSARNGRAYIGVGRAGPVLVWDDQPFFRDPDCLN